MKKVILDKNGRIKEYVPDQRQMTRRDVLIAYKPKQGGGISSGQASVPNGIHGQPIDEINNDDDRKLDFKGYEGKSVNVKKKNTDTLSVP